MIGELDLNGVFLSPVLVSAVIAFALSIAVRRALAAAGAYRVVWHPALFDTALFLILWAVVAHFPLPQWT
jgi:protein-S-isoprenylcysteine O-methyltransferase Ste14